MQPCSLAQTPWGSQRAALAIALGCLRNPAVFLGIGTAWVSALRWREMCLHQGAWGHFSVGICAPGDMGISGLSRAPPKWDADPESWTHPGRWWPPGPTRPCELKAVGV